MKAKLLILNLYIVLTILLPLTSLTAYAQHLTYTNYTYKEGLPSNIITALHVRTNGTVLIGSIGNSLFQFDGKIFKEKHHLFNKNEFRVKRIIEQKNKIIFLSQKDGLISNEEDNVTRFFFHPLEWNYLDFTVLNNQYYVFHEKGYFILDETGKQLHSIKYPNKNTLSKITSLIIHKDKILVLGPEANFIVQQSKVFTTLQHFNVDKETLSNYSYGYNLQGIVHLLDSTLQKGLIINLESHFFSIKRKETNFKLKPNEKVVDVHFNKNNNHFVLLLNTGDLLFEQNYVIERIYKNSDVSGDFTTLFIDNDENYWAGTRFNGLFKIHYTLFTKLRYAPEYNLRGIFFTHFVSNNTIIFSQRRPDVTYLGNVYEGTFKTFPFRILDKVEFPKETILATTDGVYRHGINESTLKPYTKNHLLKGKRINAMSRFREGIILVEDGTKVYFLNEAASKLTELNIPKIGGDIRIRSLNYNEKKDILYIGTTEGVYSWKKEAKYLTKVTAFTSPGDCATTTNDIFETTWFTTEDGLFGITAAGKKVYIKDNAIFKNSNLYNIEADSYGQLLIGTNRGFIILKVNNEGNVIAHKVFDSENGFEGYDTNMRSSSIVDNKILIGTSDGLFSIDLEFHNSAFVPSSPAINTLQINNENRSITFKTISIHPKFKEVYYSYKIKELDKDWSEFSTDDKFTIPNLAPGNYTLMVQSSYDKDKWSKVTTLPFEIKQLVKSNIYILYVSVGIGLLLSLLIYLRIRRRNSKQEFYKEDFFILQYISPYIVLGTGILNFGAHYVGYILIPDFHFNTYLLCSGLVICTSLFLFAKQIKPTERYVHMKRVIITHFLVIMVINEISLYQSNLEPFVALTLLIVINFSPFIFEKTANITFFGVCTFLVNLTIAFSISAPKYTPELYMISITTVVVAVFFINTIRHQSLNQLAFVSTIINNSDIYSVAFENSGKILYSTNNFTGLLQNDSINITGQNINVLLDYIPKGIELPIQDIMREFRDGKEIYLPLQFNNDPVSWIVWQCKRINKNTNVLLGTDITEKMALEDTYEILVENAQDLIYKVNKDGEFQFLNNRFTNYLPLDKNSYVGKKLTDIVPESHQAEVAQYFNQQMEGQEKVSYFEFPILDKEGNMTWIGQYMTLLHEIGYNKRITGWLATGRDITDKRIKEQLITNQSQNIRDSINYAKRIQKNLMNSGTRFDDYFHEHAIVFKPKDVVSGDFYWCIRIGEQTIIAVGDCTGHGVPGAFMSIVAINLLNSIVITSQITNPGLIMNELDIRLKAILANADDTTFRDGIELTICTLENNSNLFQYSCAGSKFIVHNTTSFDIFRGDLKHIGDEQEYFSSYVTNTVQLDPNSTIYLFTDGCHDQFGGVHNKKFTMRRLIEMIAENINLPLKNQGTIFTQEFNAWKGSQDQTDDVTLVAIRPKNKI